ncbi:hypothetical protein Acr_00g0011900 [Actinidia rufa]|uniref:Uncharacterized protein n=1 Tax=Actinidia rufa TaxID=165716 RepID=A0A7J0D9J4_9ERIC|nr:hypothetical protein Acr_00g0011900 [Actinidia rufa]
MGTSSKRQATSSRSRSGNVGTSSSGQRGESSNLDTSKFMPNSKIVSEPDETRILVGKAISRHTLQMSNAHLGVAPPPPQLRLHAVDLNQSDDETPPTTLPSAADPATTSNSRIADAITALFKHVNLIHSEWVKCIGWVHEHVDLIVEHQAYDIVAIRNTLLALSCRHTEFITKVNDFINSIRRR